MAGRQGEGRREEDGGEFGRGGHEGAEEGRGKREGDLALCDLKIQMDQLS